MAEGRTINTPLQAAMAAYLVAVNGWAAAAANATLHPGDAAAWAVTAQQRVLEQARGVLFEAMGGVPT